MRKKSHRKRFSRHSFTNIIINNDLKSILDTFKKLIKEKENKNYNISYSDVIMYLVRKLLEKNLEFNTKSYSFNFPTRKTSFITETKSFSFNFDHH